MAIWTDVIPRGSRSHRPLLAWLRNAIARAQQHQRRTKRVEATPHDIEAILDGAVGEEPAPYWDAPRHWRH